MSPARTIAAFNLHRVIGLLNSAAYARAARSHINRGSTRFSENRFANALLMAITREPGYPEVMADARLIEAAQRAHLERLLEAALRAIAHGPREVVSLLEQTAIERAQDTASVQAVFRGAIATANRMSGDLDVVIKGCAAAQLGSTVVLAVTPVGLTFAGASAAAAATGWIAFGYGVAKNLAKDMTEAKRAGVMAFEVSKEKIPKDILKEAASQGAEKVAKAMEKRIEHHGDLIELAENRIAQLSRMVEQRVSTSKLAKLNRRIGRQEATVAESERAIGAAKIGKLGARALQVVFAAHEVYEGWQEFEQVWNSP